MSVYSDFAAFRGDHHQCVATIGKYDGLHVGHQHVLDSLCNIARQQKLPAVVILSEPHPEEFFAGNNAPARLTQFDDKVSFLLDYGIDAIFRMTFDQVLCDLNADEFVRQYLVDGLGVKMLIVGDDFRFGKDRSGDFSLLLDMSREFGFTVLREGPCELADERISSTLVRETLQQGDCEKARILLGRYYSISGVVVPGKKLGRQLGTPTANIALHFSKLPLQGIFSVLVKRGDSQLQGVASLGFNPTVDDNNMPKLEVYLFDFSDDLYGEHLTVSFIKKLRDEAAYPDLESLKQQIALDIVQARQSLQTVLSN